MGGIDKLDHMISLYRFKVKTRKWSVRLIFHFVGLANSWLEYQRDNTIINKKSKYMDLLMFRGHVADALINSTPPHVPSPVGRPRREREEHETELPTSKLSYIKSPIAEIRYDNVSHLPKHVDGYLQRCKREGCKGKSRIQCVYAFMHRKKFSVFLTLPHQIVYSMIRTFVT